MLHKRKLVHFVDFFCSYIAGDGTESGQCKMVLFMLEVIEIYFWQNCSEKHSTDANGRLLLFNGQSFCCLS